MPISRSSWMRFHSALRVIKWLSRGWVSGLSLCLLLLMCSRQWSIRLPSDTLYIVQQFSRGQTLGAERCSLVLTGRDRRSRARPRPCHCPPCFAAGRRAKSDIHPEVPVARRQRLAIAEVGCDDLRVCGNGTWGRLLLAWLCNGLASPHGSWPCPTMVWVLASSRKLSSGRAPPALIRHVTRYSGRVWGCLQTGSKSLGWRSGSLTRNPVFPPFVTCAASISPRLTRCNTV